MLLTLGYVLPIYPCLITVAGILYTLCVCVCVCMWQIICLLVNSVNLVFQYESMCHKMTVVQNASTHSLNCYKVNLAVDTYILCGEDFSGA